MGGKILLIKIVWSYNDIAVYNLIKQLLLKVFEHN